MLYLNQSEKKKVGTVTVRTNENVHVNSIRAAKLWDHVDAMWWDDGEVHVHTCSSNHLHNTHRH